MTYQEAVAVLRTHGQEHVLRFWEQLSGAQRTGLLAQVATIDFAQIARMRAMLAGEHRAAAPVDIRPAEVLRQRQIDHGSDRAEGEQALRDGKVGILLVAGGQGSRLGFDGPKGAFRVAPISGAPLFEIHGRKILSLERRYGAALPFYIMTSEANDAATRAFFAEHGWFGLKPERVRFFVQGMWPALDAEGRIILDRTDHVFMSPDGHGGILSALRAGGILDDMKGRGLETLFYFQVDNPLVEIADHVFIGVHRARRADMSLKVCAKRSADEPLGVVVLRAGRSAVIEYSDPQLSGDRKRETLANGELTFQFGSVAIHVFSLDFLMREARGDLPLHLAHKKIPVCDESGKTVEPTRPNAYKFEKFIFDVLPAAARVVNLEFAREDEFSPVKNASGEDSPETTRRAMIRKWSRWLETAGVVVPRDDRGEPRFRVEIDPCYALDAAELKARLGPDFRMSGDLLLR